MKSGEGTAVQRPCGTMPSGTRKKVKAQEGTEPRGGEEGAGARPCQPGGILVTILRTPRKGFSDIPCTSQGLSTTE